VFFGDNCSAKPVMRLASPSFHLGDSLTERRLIAAPFSGGSAEIVLLQKDGAGATERNTQSVP
jgi:hypothetical protein